LEKIIEGNIHHPRKRAEMNPSIKGVAVDFFFLLTDKPPAFLNIVKWQYEIFYDNKFLTVRHENYLLSRIKRKRSISKLL